jgi:hypothetical protein
MAQSLANLIVHAVFSTRSRMKLILPDVTDDLYAYMRGIGRDLNFPLLSYTRKHLCPKPDHFGRLFWGTIFSVTKRTRSIWRKGWLTYHWNSQ